MMKILIELTKEQYKSVKNCPFTNQEKAISEGIIIDDDEITRQAKIEVLTELQAEIEELDPMGNEWSDSLDACNDIIQQKIDKLKGNENGTNEKTSDSTFSNDEVLCNR